MNRLHKLAFSSLAALALAGCGGVGPDYVAPIPAPPAQGAFLSQPAAITANAAAEGQWWRLYDDPVLDRLVEEALANNKDVAVAVANIAKARAALRGVKNDRLPQTSVGFGANYGRMPEGQRAPGVDREDTFVDTGLDISYEIDLFGRVSRNVEAARADVAQAEAERDAVRVAVAAETARAYADLNSATERLGVAERIVTLIDQTATLTSKRWEAGRGTRLDVARALALRDQQKALIPPLAAERDAARFRLATLTGRPPAELPADANARGTTLRLEKPIPVGDGAALLARRPDVRAAERRLAAQTARIGVATADLYPRITLGGSVSSTGNSFGNIFGAGPLGWLVGGLINWNFPNQEAVRARIQGAEADTQGALASFDGTVLRALQETETALSAYGHALDRRTALKSARDQAEIAARIARAQQREGRVDFLVVLDAERTFAETEAALAEADARIVTAQVDLFRALGGGWQEG
ncbi:efflux transporter, outer membrane factor (OMF) lipoprotein, NodT family [Sphingomonas laterariae]|uniref:Efflux transporter, outer membrane factor (OMF) lipoprotein, NodT family n=1 Tax=Edaphosphingomonas laterariae TaxID=861865 RepID=A0A239JW82_9SPHN|nr:TolC family protein [Sphingomonas laterariae]SNT09802.1 efflux transporter, outer membrane factor (OMF) lipoprotein, NodT family [Sphingomonas laterariae]